MKKFYSLLLLTAVMCAGSTLFGQRYLSEIFSDVAVFEDVTYGVNATVVAYASLGEAVEQDLKMDVYLPAGDTETDRPFVVYFHTGNFLPHPQNGSPTGLRTDSTAVEICSRLARMGYVAASCDYRLGWNPIAPDQGERVYTLINAAYRGMQDCRTALRYFRKSEAEDGNPYGINPDMAIVWGQGTGGYIAYAAATLSSYDDLILPKFIHEVEISPGVTVPMPMVIEEVNGDIYGTSDGVNPVDGDVLCIPNHVGYSSDVNVAVTMGGACGDLSWIDGEDAPIISCHVPTDPYAPYTTGLVIVPGLNLPVVEVSGGYDVQERLNLFGNNDVFLMADNWAPGIEFTSRANELNDGYNGLFPFERPANQQNDSAPWEWWSTSNPNHTAGLSTNPNMSAAKGRAYIDSVMGYAVPRIVCVLNLPGNPCNPITPNVDEASSVKFQVYPNPARETIALRSNATIEMVSIYDLTGKRVFFRQGMNTMMWQMNEALPSRGMYTIEVITSQGRAMQKLVIE
jgi:acetyl esterase/lipase